MVIVSATGMNVTLSGAKGLVLQSESLRSAQYDSLVETMTNAISRNGPPEFALEMG